MAVTTDKVWEKKRLGSRHNYAALQVGLNGQFISNRNVSKKYHHYNNISYSY